MDRKPAVCDRAQPTERLTSPYSCGSGCHRPRTPWSPPECTTHGGGTPARTNQHRSPESVTCRPHIGHGFCPRAPRGFSAGRFFERGHVLAVRTWSQRGTDSAGRRHCTVRGRALHDRGACAGVRRSDQDRRTRGRASGPDSRRRRGARGVASTIGVRRASAVNGGALSRCAVPLGRHVAEDGVRLLRVRAVRLRETRDPPPTHGAPAGIVRSAAASRLVGTSAWRSGHVRGARTPHQPRRDLRRASPDHPRDEQRATRALRRAGHEAWAVVRAASRCRPTRLAARGIPRR